MTASTRFQKWWLSLRRYSILHLCFAKNLTETLYVPVVIAVASQNSRQEGIRVESSIFRAKMLFRANEITLLSCDRMAGKLIKNCLTEVSFQLDFAPL